MLGVMAPRTGQAILAELSQWVAADGRVPETHCYGPGPEHEADLLLPGDSGGGADLVLPGDASSGADLLLTGAAGASGGVDPGHPVAVLVHGGFWRAEFNRGLMSAMALDLADRGWASWNIEYRRIGTGGGPAEMIADVRAAIDALGAVAAPLDPSRVVVIGHSAGGQLGLCAARMSTVAGVVSLAGVCDLVAAARERIGDSAALELMGAGPDERPEPYAAADPLQQLPTGIAVLLVHGDADDRVPVEQSRTYARAARAAGERCELLELGGVDHFDLIDPRTDAWDAIAGRLDSLLR
jgi:acetyl esterase/lipase